MLNKEIIISRLALIKYLYRTGIEQSKQAEPISAFSILTLHDGVEMFLKLLAEHQNIKSDNFNFLQYWESIPELTLKESMRSFNARRVNIKHKGLLPSKSDIEISRVSVTEFFEQNTFPRFGVEFKDVSLFSLVQYENVRQHLEEAQKSLDEGRMEDCAKTIAIAFEELILSYENSKSAYFRDSPFAFGEDFTFLDSSFMGIEKDSAIKFEEKLGNFVDKVITSLKGIQKAVRIMSFGIDYKKFVKFKLLTPAVEKIHERYHISTSGRHKLTKENCQYSIDFVLDCSLKFQDFDFDIKEVLNDSPTFEDIMSPSIKSALTELSAHN